MPLDATKAHATIIGSPLFRGVAPNVASAAIAELELLELAPGEAVVIEGTSESTDGDASLYVLVEGHLIAARAIAGGRTQRLSTMTPGDFFGELARVEEGTRSATVRAVTPVVVARLPGPAADRLIAAAPIVMRTIAAAIAARLRAADEARIAARLAEERLSLIGKAAAMLVHDLKGPLGRVINAAECIDDGVGDRSKMTATCRRAAEFMLALVEDLCAYAKGEQGYARAPVRIADVISDVEVYGLAPLEAQGKVAVQRVIRGDGTLIGDHRALSRALLNIIKNAGEEMSTTGGTLTFEANVEETTARFIIADTGRGIPDHVLPTIFEPFATYLKKSGTGLGMAMAKAAIDAHDGNIQIATKMGEGTRFIVTVPMTAKG